MKKEVWKTCRDFTAYEVSNLGRVRRWYPPANKKYYRKTGRYKGQVTQHYTREGFYKYLKASIFSGGYYGVGLYDDEGKAYSQTVHRLVCIAFHGYPPTPRHTVDHLDGDRTNNHVSNLRWATHSEQRDTARRLGTLNAGDNHYKSKIPSADIPKIRAEYVRGCPVHGAAAIAKRYCVTRQCIGMIVRGVNHKGD